MSWWGSLEVKYFVCMNADLPKVDTAWLDMILGDWDMPTSTCMDLLVIFASDIICWCEAFVWLTEARSLFVSDDDTWYIHMLNKKNRIYERYLWAMLQRFCLYLAPTTNFLHTICPLEKTTTQTQPTIRSPTQKIFTPKKNTTFFSPSAECSFCTRWYDWHLSLGREGLSDLGGSLRHQSHQRQLPVGPTTRSVAPKAFHTQGVCSAHGFSQQL